MSNPGEEWREWAVGRIAHFLEKVKAAKIEDVESLLYVIEQVAIKGQEKIHKQICGEVSHVKTH